MKKNREWRVESCPGVEKRDEGGTFLRKEEKKRETKKKKEANKKVKGFSLALLGVREKEREGKETKGD